MTIEWLGVTLLLCLQITVDGNDLHILPQLSEDAHNFCGKGWYKFENMCYKLGGKKKVGVLSWEEAAKTCQEKFNGNLVTIHSQELQDFLTAFIGMTARHSVWIGLHDRINETVYSWDGDSPVEYTNWEPGEPSGPASDKEDCAEMVFYSGRPNGKSGQWNDLPCDRKLQFICQKEMGTRRYLDAQYCSHKDGVGWSFETSCYNLVIEKKTWPEAEEFCVQRFSGHLVTMTDFSARLFLDYVLKDHKEEMWIGIKTKEERQQKWISGWYVSYEYWSEDEEEFTAEACVYREVDSRWSATSCTKEYSFVCEYSTVTPPTLTPPSDEFICPSEPSDWRDLGGNYCYHFGTTTPLTWQNANFQCTRRGGSLASIHSDEESNMLYNFVRYSLPAVHIGYYRHLQKDEEFVWMDESPVDFINWDSNEPNSETEQCTEMRPNMKWNDIGCENERYYICSVPKMRLNQTTEETVQQTSCSTGYSRSALLGVIFCVILLSALGGLVAYYFRVCDRSYDRLRKRSSTTMTPSANDKRPKYRSEMIVNEVIDPENLV